MKYLVEGKWEDFKPNFEEVNKKINKLKLDIDEINNELLEHIIDCMVDLEECQTGFIIVDDMIDSAEYYEGYLCIYNLLVPIKKIPMLIELKEKLDNVIGNGYEFYYYRGRNQLDYDSFMGCKNDMSLFENSSIEFLFKKIENNG